MDATVIGAGVFGSWCAWRLADAGHRVTLIDAYGPANGRASSADHSRVIRAGYGADAIYSQWATAAWHEWEWLSAQTGQSLVTKTGALFMGEAGNAYVRASYDTLVSLNSSAEWLETDAIARRFPQISVAALGPCLFEPDAGVIRARAAVQALVRLAVSRANVEYRVDAMLTPDEDQAAAMFRTASGLALNADVYVIACGAWLPEIVPRAIGSRIRPTRQEVLYFGVPPGDVSFSVPKCPVWIDFAAGVYGIPDMEGRGFKVGIDRHGAPLDPNSVDRVVDSQLVTQTREWLTRRFPGLAAAPLVDSRVCQYENTSSGDFIIDHHPSWPNVWIVGGGSGHGFKHGPSVARYVMALIAGDESPDPRFALSSKAVESRRTVY